MNQNASIAIEEIVFENHRLKTLERDCPGCDAILVFNETEQCFECLKCGYINCGDEGY